MINSSRDEKEKKKDLFLKTSHNDDDEDFNDEDLARLSIKFKRFFIKRRRMSSHFQSKRVILIIARGRKLYVSLKINSTQVKQKMNPMMTKNSCMFFGTPR